MSISSKLRRKEEIVLEFDIPEARINRIPLSIADRVFAFGYPPITHKYITNISFVMAELSLQEPTKSKWKLPLIIIQPKPKHLPMSFSIKICSQPLDMCMLLVPTLHLSMCLELSSRTRHSIFFMSGFLSIYLYLISSAFLVSRFSSCRRFQQFPEIFDLNFITPSTQRASLTIFISLESATCQYQ